MNCDKQERARETTLQALEAAKEFTEQAATSTGTLLGGPASILPPITNPEVVSYSIKQGIKMLNRPSDKNGQ